jgi:hypothetical protein
MSKVAIITEAQKDELIGEKFSQNSFFNPIQDVNNNWVISIEEIEKCENEFKPDWFDSLVLVDLKPKVSSSIITNKK